MRSFITPISGNAFRISLEPETENERLLLDENTDSRAVSAYYRDAIRQEFGETREVASLTPDDNFPYSMTAELVAISGSV